MHPQAISRVLDAEASKWIQSDDGTFEVFPLDNNNDSDTSAEARAPIARRMSLPAKQLSLEDRSKVCVCFGVGVILALPRPHSCNR